MSDELRVVLIEDDPDLRQLIRAALEFSAGWDVRVASDGWEGLELARVLKPDVTLVDLMLPGMDGYEVCRRLASDADTSGTALVLLTARTHLDREKIKACNVAGVIAKPFDPETLASQIRACVGAAGTRSET